MCVCVCVCRQRKKERDRLKSERHAMRNAEERKMSHTLPNPDPYNQFQALHVPTLDPDIATSQLFSLLREVPLRQVRSSYPPRLGFN